MEITVNRIHSDSDATLSTVYIDGKFQCFGLEDEYRAHKVAKETRIPAGKYQVTLRTVGGKTQKYAARYPGIHKGMLWVRDVPEFEYILIHTGNTDEHTDGCLLIGKNAQTHGEIGVGASRLAYVDFYQKVVDAAENNELTIEYVDRDL